MLRKLGGEEADKDEVWRSAWSVWTHIVNEVHCDFAVSVIVWRSAWSEFVEEHVLIVLKNEMH